MKAAIVGSLCLVLCGAGAWADFNRRALEAFQLQGSPLLQGFTSAKPKPGTVPREPAVPRGATASVRRELYHGPSEVIYSVDLFPTRAVLSGWDQQMARMSPAWVSPLKATARNGVQEITLGGVLHPRLPRATAVVVNRCLITLGVAQHQEMIRRQPALKDQALSDTALAKRMAQIRAELIRLAKAHPENQP